jgi:hypothetical protein
MPSWRRLRWRLRGAWQWPAFVGLTLLDGLLLVELPFYASGPADVPGGLLLAGFLNLLALVLLAPLGGSVLRRRRPDLPVVVARDSAGTALLCAVSAALLAGGLAHRPAVENEAAARMAATAGAAHWIAMDADPRWRRGIAAIDTVRIERDYYRVCVPGPDSDRWLCLFVSTAQDPPGITVDRDQVSNADYRHRGGFG